MGCGARVLQTEGVTAPGRVGHPWQLSVAGGSRESGWY